MSILKLFTYQALAIMLFVLFRESGYGQILDAKPMIDGYDRGLYELIVKLREERSKLYNKCIDNNFICSGIFSTEFLYSIDENGIGYYSEGSFLSTLTNKKDIGIDNKEFYLLFSYGCRVSLTDRNVKKFISIYLPHPNYYNYIKLQEKVNFANSFGSSYFFFKKGMNGGTTFLFNDNYNDVDDILNILRKQNRIRLSIADDAIISKMEYTMPQLEEKVFSRLCKTN